MGLKDLGYRFWEEGQELPRHNLEIFKREELLAFSILQKNRHSTAEPYEWFGPEKEIHGPGPKCPCFGCQARYSRLR